MMLEGWSCEELIVCEMVSPPIKPLPPPGKERESFNTWWKLLFEGVES
jgi:hypothetical protein